MITIRVKTSKRNFISQFHKYSSFKRGELGEGEGGLEGREGREPGERKEWRNPRKREKRGGNGEERKRHSYVTRQEAGENSKKNVNIVKSLAIAEKVKRAGIGSKWYGSGNGRF